MKKLLFVFIVCNCVLNFAYADSPIEKDTYSLSGSISYSESDNSSFGRSKDLFVYPGFLYFISPNLGIGGRLQYWHSSDNTFNYKSYGVAPAIRYYFTQNNSMPFIELSYGYEKSKSSSSSNTSRGHSKSAGIIFGLDYFLSRNVALEPSIAYRHYRYDSDSGSSITRENNTLTMGIGINVFIY